MKRCSNKNCQKQNPVFAKNKAQKDGLNNQCRVCVKAGYLKRYAVNKDKILEDNRQYRKTHKGIMNAIKREWRRRNPEKNLEITRNYRRNNIDRVRMLDRAQTSKRRAWLRGVPSDGSTLADLLERNPECICHICTEKIEGKIHIDHIIPIARGGHDTINNKGLAHPFCNQSKGARLLGASV